MAIAIQCPSCHTEYHVKAELAGRKAKCRKCGRVFGVPAAAQDTGAAPGPGSSVAGAPDEQSQRGTPAVRDGAGKPAGPPTDSRNARAGSGHMAQADRDLGTVREHTCPGCGARLTPGAVLCVACGLDLRTGRMTPTFKPAAEPGRRGPGYDSQPARGGGTHRWRRLKRRVLDRSGPVASTVLPFVLIAVFLGGGGWLGYKIWKYWAAQWWLTEVIDLAKAGQSAAAAQRLGADLPTAVYLLPDLQSNPQHARKQSVFVELITSLPPEVDLSPLLSVPPESFAYSAVCSAVAKNATLDWRLEKSCNPDPIARQIAISGLRETFPLGLVDEAGMAQLAEPMSVEEKKSLYQRLYQQAHQKVEDILCGDFRVKLEATYRTARGPMPTESLLTPAPVIRVSCKERVFTIRMFDQSWTGTFGELASCRMSCKLGQEKVFSGLRILDRAPDAVLNLSYERGQLRIAPSQFRQYVPPRAERAEGYHDERSELDKALDALSGARVSVTQTDMYGQETTTTYQNGQVVDEFSTIPAIPGFEKFEASLIRAR